MKHTPGPWHLGMRQAEQIVYNDKGWAVANATVYHGKEGREEMKANARLIAAAPDLLVAARLAAEFLDIFEEQSEAAFGQWNERRKVIRAAIAKATA